MTFSRSLILTLVTLCIAWPSTVLSQAPAQSREPRLSLSWSVGVRMLGGPSAALERAMVAAGVDDHHPGGLGFFGPYPGFATPRTKQSPGRILAAVFKVGPTFGLRAEVGGAGVAHTEGYRAPRAGMPIGSYVSLDVYQTVTSVSVVPFAALGKVLQFGAGPSINFLKVSESWEEGPGSHAMRPGASLFAAVTSRRRVFLEVALRLHWVMSANVGPFGLAACECIPRTRLSPSSASASVGLGVRL